MNINKSTTPVCFLNDIRGSFLMWVGEHEIDRVSVVVLGILLDKYQNGDRDPLFLKYQQLINYENYKLAVIFRDCLTYVGINDEFRAWQANNPIKINQINKK